MEDPALKKKDLGDLKGGYPDCGNGVYADKLTYEEWFRFNKVNRGHLNFLESVTIVTFVILVSGLEFPRAAVILGSLYALFRPLYFLQNRFIGFLPA